MGTKFKLPVQRAYLYNLPGDTELVQPQDIYLDRKKVGQAMMQHQRKEINLQGGFRNR